MDSAYNFFGILGLSARFFEVRLDFLPNGFWSDSSRVVDIFHHFMSIVKNLDKLFQSAARFLGVYQIFRYLDRFSGSRKFILPSARFFWVWIHW